MSLVFIVSSLWFCMHTYYVAIQHSQEAILSSCCTASTDLPDPISLPVSILHRFREVFQATPCIGIEVLYMCSSWSSCLCSSIWRGQREYIAYEFVLTSPAVSCMSGSGMKLYSKFRRLTFYEDTVTSWLPNYCNCGIDSGGKYRIFWFQR